VTTNLLPTHPVTEAGIFLPGELRYLSAAEIGVDTDYQRALNPKHVAKIVEGFDPDLFGVLLISEREEGVYYVLDGQHRVVAIERMGMTTEPLPCLVYSHLTPQLEAKIFAQVNAGRLYLSPQYTFRAQIIARQPEALAIKAIVESFGFHLNFWKPLPDDESAGMFRPEGMLSAIGEIKKLRTSYRIDMLPQVLAVCRDAWGSEAVGISANILRGIAQFLYAYGERVDRERLLGILANLTPKRLEAEGKDRYLTATPAGISKYIQEQYNYHQGRRTRLPDRNWRKRVEAA
jgi:hypothetical protein